jgi:hypothetical protein
MHGLETTSVFALNLCCKQKIIPHLFQKGELTDKKNIAYANIDPSHVGSKLDSCVSN